MPSLVDPIGYTQTGPAVSTDPVTDMGIIEAKLSPEEGIDPLLDYYGRKLFRYEEIQTRLNHLITQWDKSVSRRAALNRNIRNLEVDLDSLHKSGDLGPDETYIPIRVVAENIRQDLPPFIRYLTTSHRLVVFNCVSDPQENTEELETQVTKGLRYNNWEKVPFKNLDGTKLHGWAAIKVELDDSKPLNVNLHYVRHESLIFDLESHDLQANEIILEEHHVTLLQLESFVKKYGFDARQVRLVQENIKDNAQKVQEPFKIHEVFFKWDGFVWVSWVCMEKGYCTTWLKAPSKFFLDVGQEVTTTVMVPTPSGIDAFGNPIILPVPTPQTTWEPIYETDYPYEILINEETEDTRLACNRGRAWEDQSKQEAQTALFSMYINGATRASNVYGAPEESANPGSPIKKLELSLDPGCFYSEPMRFWSPPYPSPELLHASNMLDVRTQAERGRVASTVINRKDARKTSAEIETAEDKELEMESVGLVLYSSFWRNILARVWRIVQSQAVQNKIALLQIPVPNPQTGTVEYVNDIARLKKHYEVFPAGDVDVIEREKNLKKMAEFYPIVSQVPVLGLTFLDDMMKVAFPRDSKKYSGIIQGLLQMQVQSLAQPKPAGAAPGSEQPAPTP